MPEGNVFEQRDGVCKPLVRKSKFFPDFCFLQTLLNEHGFIDIFVYVGQYMSDVFSWKQNCFFSVCILNLDKNCH